MCSKTNDQWKTMNNFMVCRRVKNHIWKKEVNDEIIKDLLILGYSGVSRKEKYFSEMNITINEEKYIEIKNKKRLQEYVILFREEINGSVTSPTQKHLLEVNKNEKNRQILK